MKNSIKVLIVLTAAACLWAGNFIFAQAVEPTDDSQALIRAVENGLRPTLIVKGESVPKWNIFDRMRGKFRGQARNRRRREIGPDRGSAQ